MAASESDNPITQLLARRRLASYGRHSRAHLLNTFPPNVYVKRDDELSFGVTGSKMRKYLSLVPSLKSSGVKQVVLIGGASSNNIVGLSQLLIEEGLQPVLFLCGHRPERPTGNLLIVQSLVDPQHIHWHGRDAWPVIEELAHEYAQSHGSCRVIPEGASCSDAIPGALTLALDILENERGLGVTFDNIVCDAGTGMMAAALILGNSLLGRKVHHHIVLLADTDEAFLQALDHWKRELETLSGITIGTLAPVILHRPASAPSFGSVNASVRREVQRMAREEGILTDPVYSAKLFATARTLTLDGSSLVIHSGGALGAIGNMAPKIHPSSES